MEFPIGVDVSKYNYGWNPDYTKKPISFVIQRASWSMYKDEKFDEIYKQVVKIPIRGAYHYYSTGVKWIDQANLFLSIVKDLSFHFYVLDYEKAYNNINAKSMAEVYEFIKYIKQQTGKKCLIYFNPDVYNTGIKAFGYEKWANEQDVWIAQYPWTLTEEITQKYPALPSGLNNWKIWQYGGGDINFTAGRNAGENYGGGLKGIDLNKYNGTLEDMKYWLSINESTPLPEVQESIVSAKAAYNMNVRNGAGVNFQIIGGLIKGSTALISKIEKGSGDSVWGKICEERYVCLYLNGIFYTSLTEFPSIKYYPLKYK